MFEWIHTAAAEDAHARRADVRNHGATYSPPQLKLTEDIDLSLTLSVASAAQVNE